ncbi:MAG: 3-deoxy-D-manno-octulosonic acid transferase [Verrucomicrobiales bacterium]|nr:3-deoxy-D-manno-octulosonic acid transferase [Verrucomicrobiales bacterium]
MIPTPAQHVALRLYQAALHVGLPAGMLLTLPFLLAKTKRRRTVFRRLGFQRIPRDAGRPAPLWIHALSLGETLSCVPLVKELRARLEGRPIAFTVSTLSAREIAEQRLGDCVDQLLYFPFDLAPSIELLVRRLRPAMAVFIETDIWPGILHHLRGAGLPTLLANGRLSPQSYRTCRRLRLLFEPALNSFETIFPQSEGEACRYREVGVEPARLGPVGNLKFETGAVELSEPGRNELMQEYGIPADVPIWLAGSTHAGEEELLLAAFKNLRPSFPELRLVIVPRHPARGAAVRTLGREAGLDTRRFTEPERGAVRDILVVDAMGRLAALYHLADIAFVGGSLVPKGGQNPIEPAAAGVPVLFGPDMTDFPDIAAELLSREAAFQVQGSAELTSRVRELLDAPEDRRRMGQAGRAFIAAHAGTTRRVADHILTRLTSAVQKDDTN